MKRASDLNFSIKLFGGLAILFGIATIISGGNAILALHGVSRPDDAVVPFVLYFNFAAGFAYIANGTGLILRRHWAPTLAAFIAVATIIVFAGLGVWIFVGNAYETKTVIAMTLRAAFWSSASVVAAIGYRGGATRPLD